MPQADVYLKTGDTQPAISVQVVNETNDPIDLDGATVRFRMSPIMKDGLVIDKPAIIQSPVDEGRIAYKWGSGDTTEAGTYQAEFAIDYDGDNGQDFDADETVPANEERSYITVEIMETV